MITTTGTDTNLYLKNNKKFDYHFRIRHDDEMMKWKRKLQKPKTKQNENQNNNDNDDDSIDFNPLKWCDLFEFVLPFNWKIEKSKKQKKIAQVKTKTTKTENGKQQKVSKKKIGYDFFWF